MMPLGVVASAHVSAASGLSFADDFNRADSGDIGANWTGPGKSLYTISGNRLSASAPDGIQWTSATSSDDNWSQITVADKSSTTSLGVYCRLDASGENGYLWRTTGTTIQILKRVGTAFTALGTGYAHTLTNGDVLKITASGSTITGYLNGVQRQQITDTSVTSGKYVGIRANASLLDDWSGGDL